MGKLARVIDDFTPEMEHRVLVGKMRKGGSAYFPDTEYGCLLQVATGSATAWLSMPGWNKYDSLCVRFKDARINNAIRNRFLSNQAKRLLPTPAEATA